MFRICISLVLLLSQAPASADDPVTHSLDGLARELAEVRATHGAWSVDAIEPLVRLGARAARQQSHEEAIEYLKAAQHILHRQEGVYTLSQDELLKVMARSYLSLADIETSDRLMQFRHEVYKHHYGTGDLRLVPSMVELGNWFQMRAAYREAKSLYTDALGILRAQHGDGRAVQQTLNQLAFTEYLEGRCCSLELIEEAVDQALADEVSDFADRASAMRSAADVMILGGYEERANEVYVAAAEITKAKAAPPVWLGVSRGDRMVRAYEPLLTGRSTRSSLRPNQSTPPGKLVGAPLAFCESQLEGVVGGGRYREFEIELEFVVDEEGRARQIKVLESNATAAVDMLAARVLRTSRFRPVVREGKVVSEKVRLTQRFDEDVTLSSSSSPFPPANLAVFHACHSLARFH